MGAQKLFSWNEWMNAGWEQSFQEINEGTTKCRGCRQWEAALCQGVWEGKDGVWWDTLDKKLLWTETPWILTRTKRENWRFQIF